LERFYFVFLGGVGRQQEVRVVVGSFNFCHA